MAAGPEGSTGGGVGGLVPDAGAPGPALAAGAQTPAPSPGASAATWHLSPSPALATVTPGRQAQEVTCFWSRLGQACLPESHSGPGIGRRAQHLASWSTSGNGSQGRPVCGWTEVGCPLEHVLRRGVRAGVFLCSWGHALLIPSTYTLQRPQGAGRPWPGASTGLERAK